MKRLEMIVAAAAWALAVSGTAYAAPPGAFKGAAKLATPVSAPVEKTVNGVTWRCVDDACVGTAERYSTLDSFMKECRKVSAELGPLTTYVSRGLELSKARVASCNKAAERYTQTAQK